MKIFKISLLLILQSCSISLLPNNEYLSFYDLDLIDQSEEYRDTLCIPNSSQSNQILIKKVKTLRPYDGFKVYQKNKEMDLSQIGDVQWIAPLSTLFPSKIEELVNLDCHSNDLRPTFTTNIITRTDDQLGLTLAVVRISEENAVRVAEAKVNANMSSEITGMFVLNRSKTVKLKLERGTSHVELIKTLQKAIRIATIEVLKEIKNDRY